MEQISITATQKLAQIELSEAENKAKQETKIAEINRRIEILRDFVSMPDHASEIDAAIKLADKQDPRNKGRFVLTESDKTRIILDGIGNLKLEKHSDSKVHKNNGGWHTDEVRNLKSPKFDREKNFGAYLTKEGHDMLVAWNNEADLMQIVNSRIEAIAKESKSKK